MKRITLCLLLAVAALAKEPEAPPKPSCKAPIHGRFWPDAANSDSNAARKLAQCGVLEICAHPLWRYKWQSVTVNVRQLGKAPQEPTPACAAIMEEYGLKDR